MAFSMSLASPMLRSLWRACCVSSALRGLTYHRHKYGGWVPSEATGVGKLKAGGVRCAQWLLPRETSEIARHDAELRCWRRVCMPEKRPITGTFEACHARLRNYHHNCGWTCRLLSPPTSHLR